MSEVITVRCHGCRVGMKIKAEYAGKLRKCPKCGTIFVVPSQDGETTPPAPEVLAELRRQAALAKKKEQEAEASAGSPGSSASSAGPASPASVSETSPRPAAPKITFGFGGASSENAIGAFGSGAGTNSSEETSEDIQAEGGIHPVERPKRLEPAYRYVILDSERMVAYWQNETGWQVNDGVKLVSARRNAQVIPKQGDFRFLELQLGTVDEEFRITKIRIFQLARQYSVTKIAQEENDVLSTITRHAGLTRSQKNALLQGLKKHFMRSVWADSPAVYDYLMNEDFHSHEIS